MTKQERFRHLAFLYSGEDEFVDGTLSFIREGVESGEPVLVVVNRRKIDLLRSALDGGANSVHFGDMAEIGLNPARIIPAWQDFLDAHSGRGRPVRGIGEPIWAERSPAELAECQRHESLLNVAFADTPAWSLLCPYDVSALDHDIIEEAHRSHPVIVNGQGEWPSPYYRDIELVAPFEGALPEPPGESPELVFRIGPLEAIRAFVAWHATAAGLTDDRAADLVLAVNEVTTNSLCHGGGEGVLRIWQDGDAVICDVRDQGLIGDPLVGRQRPNLEKDCGRGLWLANQLCELVQVRSSAGSTVVRLHMRRD